MKKLIKINVLVLLASMLGLTTFALIARDELRTEGTSEYISEKYDSATLNELKIDAVNRSIEIVESTTDEINVEFYVSRADSYTLKVTDDTLKLELKTNFFENIIYNSVFINIQLNPITHVIKVHVPTDTLERFNMKTTNGTVKISDVKTDALNALTTNGTITVKNTIFNTSELITSNGTIELEKVSGTSVTMRSANGTLKGENINVASIRANTSNGEIKLQDISTDNISSETSNGNIAMYINGAYADYKTTVTTNNGSIRIDDVKIFSGTYNTSSAKTVKATTSNGSIKLYFV